mgnify:CR=1 FL=1
MERKKTWIYITNLGIYIRKKWHQIAKKNKGRIWCVANMRYHPAFKTIEKNFKNLGKIY